MPITVITITIKTKLFNIWVRRMESRELWQAYRTQIRFKERKRNHIERTNLRLIHSVIEVNEMSSMENLGFGMSIEYTIMRPVR